MTTPQPLVLVIGGTGAQGIPVVKALSANNKYQIRIITRNTSSPESLDLASHNPNITLFEGNAYHEPDLRKAFAGGVTHVFANTNGFAIGEKAEIYWGIRMYELAREFGVAHFLYAGLEYASKLGNFAPKYRTGHLDGKGKVVDYLKSQPTTPMTWSVLTSCLYIEGLSEILRPFPQKDGSYIFSAPLGSAKLPLIHLEDYGLYACWLLDNPERSAGMELHVGTEDISYTDLAQVFTEVTGKKAIYKDVTTAEYFDLGIFKEPEARIGVSSENVGDETLFTYRENFGGFWETWKAELTHRDYGLLDEILPGRVRSVKEWMVKVGYTGELVSVLKDYRDGARVAAREQ